MNALVITAGGVSTDIVVLEFTKTSENSKVFIELQIKTAEPEKLYIINIARDRTVADAKKVVSHDTHS